MTPKPPNEGPWAYLQSLIDELADLGDTAVPLPKRNDHNSTPPALYQQSTPASKERQKADELARLRLREAIRAERIRLEAIEDAMAREPGKPRVSWNNTYDAWVKASSSGDNAMKKPGTLKKPVAVRAHEWPRAPRRIFGGVVERAALVVPKPLPRALKIKKEPGTSDEPWQSAFDGWVAPAPLVQQGESSGWIVGFFKCGKAVLCVVLTLMVASLATAAFLRTREMRAQAQRPQNMGQYVVGKGVKLPSLSPEETGPAQSLLQVPPATADEDCSLYCDSGYSLTLLPPPLRLTAQPPPLRLTTQPPLRLTIQPPLLWLAIDAPKPLLTI